MRVVWSPLAIERAAEAAAFIAKDSPAAARELLFGNYRVVYRIEPRRVAILTVRHLRRRFDPEEVR
jgi:plasmid stabilization system protein ParE